MNKKIQEMFAFRCHDDWVDLNLEPIVRREGHMSISTSPYDVPQKALFFEQDGFSHIGVAYCVDDEPCCVRKIAPNIWVQEGRRSGRLHGVVYWDCSSAAAFEAWLVDRQQDNKHDMCILLAQAIQTVTELPKLQSVFGL